jgi:hypothetical protein
MRKELPELVLEGLDFDQAVHLPKQEEYDAFMQVLEAGKFKVLGNHTPTNSNLWMKNKEETCIKTEGHSVYLSSLAYERGYSEILSGEKFYESREVSQEKRDEINSWFEKYKPNRASKGLENKINGDLGVR